MLGAPAMAQPCNPVLDGTYCAEEARRSSNISPRRATFGTIRNIGDDFPMAPDEPGTLGAITFRGNGTKCIGLMRRGACN
jgi:hypothetical protein